MKITESRLRRIIREVIAEASGVDDQEAALRSAVSDIEKKIADLGKLDLPDETYIAAYRPLERERQMALKNLHGRRKADRGGLRKVFEEAYDKIDAAVNEYESPKSRFNGDMSRLEGEIASAEHIVKDYADRMGLSKQEALRDLYDYQRDRDFGIS